METGISQKGATPDNIILVKRLGRRAQFDLLVWAQGFADSFEKGLGGGGDLVRIARGIERDILFVAGQKDVGGVAVRLGEVFGFGPDDSPLNLGGVNINHVVRRIDDAGLDHDNEFLTFAGFDGGAKEVFDDRDFRDEGEPTDTLGVTFGDAAANRENRPVRDRNFVIERLGEDIGNVIAVDQSGAGDSVVDLIDLDRNFVLGVDEGADFEDKFDIFILDVGGDRSSAAGYDRGLLVGRNGDPGTHPDVRNFVIRSGDVGLGQDFEAGGFFEGGDVGVEELADSCVEVEPICGGSEAGDRVQIGRVEESAPAGGRVEARQADVLATDIDVLDTTKKVDACGDVITKGDLSDDSVDVDLQGTLVHFLDELGNALDGFGRSSHEEGVHPRIRDEESLADHCGTGQSGGGLA